MSIKALIIDLDNTVYPVPSIGHQLFRPLFDLLQESGAYKGDLEDIKQDIMRKPFQKVAEEYGFSEQLKKEGDTILQDLTYNRHIPAFEDYDQLRRLPYKKYLVTTGYTKMQQSKVEMLGIRQDFEEIHIVDPSKTDDTKKDVFQDIIKRHDYKPEEVVVIGDDPESELQAGRELGLSTVLYSKEDGEASGEHTRIAGYGELKELLAQNKV